MRSADQPAAPPLRPAHLLTLSRFSHVPRRVRWLIYLLSFLTVSQGFYYVIVTAYLPEIGVSGGDVGLILGTSAASVVLSAIPLGMLSDRRGRKRVFLLGTLGLPPALLVYAFTTDVLYLVLAAIVVGVAQGAFLTTWNAMIADQTTQENRDHAFSLSFVVNIVANGAGASIFILFPVLSDWTGASIATLHHDALIFFAGFACLSPLSLAFLLRDFEEVSYPRSRIFGRGRKMGLLVRFSLLNGLIGLGAGFIIPLIATWLWLRFSVPDTLSGPLLAVSNMTVGFAALWSAGLAKRLGPVKAIALTEGLSTIFMVSLAFVPNAALAGGLYIVRAALMMMSSPISDSYLMSIIAPEDRGVASAINSIVWRLPNSATTVVGGALLQGGHFELPFLLAASFYLTSIGGFYATFRNVRPSKEDAVPARA
ncbi:MAG TPA: MFS transporter [Thermoplasmata archaeon]|nr:MFS transporter [Thermoplasmata archaeon]